MPEIDYRESVNSAAEKLGSFLDLSGRRRFAKCWLRVAPNTRGAGLAFSSELTSAELPDPFIAAVEQGVIASLQSGILARYPVVDVVVTLYDASHDSDSDEDAFAAAASTSFRAACSIAHPVLLEPLYTLEIVTPLAYSEPVLGDVSARRGQVEEVITSGGNKIVRAAVPEAELENYEADLATVAGGQASHTMVFSHYAIVPEATAAAIIASRQL